MLYRHCQLGDPSCLSDSLQHVLLATEPNPVNEMECSLHVYQIPSDAPVGCLVIFILHRTDGVHS